MIIVYPNPNTGESSKLVSTSGTSIGIAVDDGRLTLSVESQIPHVSFRENFALRTDPIQGGIVEARNDGHTIPVFVFGIGGWNWNAPFTLGAETPDRCAQIATALREGKASNYEGWKIDLCLVDSLTLSTTARCAVAAPPSYWSEVVVGLLKTECTDLYGQAVALNNLYERVPSNSALFRRARRTYRLA
jgi:hypothetical protein